MNAPMSELLSKNLDVTGTVWRPKLTHVAIGAFVVAVAVMLVVGALQLPQDKGYSIVGAQAFPLAVAFLLGVVGGGLLWQGLTGGFRFLPGPEGYAIPISNRQWRGALWVSAGLLINALLITHIGFVLSSTLLFAAAARGFGSFSYRRDLTLGLMLTVPVYLGFTKGLSVPLPALIRGWI